MTLNHPILILTPFFSPNIGGVETHLDDLVTKLNHHQIPSVVLTYSPLTTDVTYQKLEIRGRCTIHRFAWPGYNLFPRLEKYPILTFLYLTPYLLLRSCLWSLTHRFSLIHSHGLNAAFIGFCLSRIFNTKHLLSIHAVYDNFQPNFLSRFLINHTDHILTLSTASRQQLLSWRINPQKISLFHHWVNLTVFRPTLQKSTSFSVLFLGRLITKKGVKILVKVARQLPHIRFDFIGTGPLSPYLRCLNVAHINYLGPVANHQLPDFISRHHLLCCPSLYAEGFGRSVMESLACGTPVVASNLGGLPEALDNSVAILTKPTVSNLKQAILTMQQNYRTYQPSCRPYALKHFSSKNFQSILSSYRRLLNTD